MSFIARFTLMPSFFAEPDETSGAEPDVAELGGTEADGVKADWAKLAVGLILLNSSKKLRSSSSAQLM
jgi:hypothetical protein